MPRSNVLVALITLSFLWGSSFLAIKLVIDVVPLILVFGIRFAIGSAARPNGHLPTGMSYTTFPFLLNMHAVVASGIFASILLS